MLCVVQHPFTASTPLQCERCGRSPTVAVYAWHAEGLNWETMDRRHVCFPCAQIAVDNALVEGAAVYDGACKIDDTDDLMSPNQSFNDANHLPSERGLMMWENAGTGHCLHPTGHCMGSGLTCPVYRCVTYSGFRFQERILCCICLEIVGESHSGDFMNMAMTRFSVRPRCGYRRADNAARQRTKQTISLCESCGGRGGGLCPYCSATGIHHTA